MLFSSQPMGAEEYYIYVNADSEKIKSGDIRSPKDAKIGINKDSFQEILLREWMKKYNVEAQVIELVTSQDESVQMLKNKDIK